MRFRPVAVEFDLYEEDESLAEDLRAAGHEVWLQRPVEKRGGIHHAAADVVIQIATDLGSEAIAAAVTAAAIAARNRLRGRKAASKFQGTKHVAIVDGQGKLLSEIEVPDAHTE